MKYSRFFIICSPPKFGWWERLRGTQLKTPNTTPNTTKTTF